MRLPDEVLKCVVFLGHFQDESGRRNLVLDGTGFLVDIPFPHVGGSSMIYLVTARHVAEGIEPDFAIRTNNKSGKFEIIEITGQRWFYHPTDTSVDVGVLPWGPPPTTDYASVPEHMFAGRKEMEDKGIGVGDETFVTGLFVPVTGNARNMPIVRTGHLAMVPDEQIPVSNWYTPTIDAFLIEMRSLGGLSGSPVFVQRSVKVQPAEHSGRDPLGAGAIFLLRLIRGHWDMPKTAIDVAAAVDANSKRDDLFNSGIAIVIPAGKIIEVIDNPELVERVKSAEQDILIRNPHTLDGGSPLKVKDSQLPDFRLTVGVSAASKGVGLGAVQVGTTDTAGAAQATKDGNPQHDHD